MWDVDNDGDGITDSVWIDPGLPVVTAPDGRQYKKLVAVLVPRTAPSAPPMEKFDAGIEPKGPRPAPRNFVSPEEERDLRSSPDFPWNALDGSAP